MTQRESVPYRVYMTDTKTGESHNALMGSLWIFPDEDGSHSLFWWEEGNMSCDCNRYHFMPASKAAGPVPPCGDGRYTVRCVSDDGEVLYTEEETSQHTKSLPLEYSYSQQQQR